MNDDAVQRVFEALFTEQLCFRPWADESWVRECAAALVAASGLVEENNRFRAALEAWLTWWDEDEFVAGGEEGAPVTLSRVALSSPVSEETER